MRKTSLKDQDEKYVADIVSESQKALYAMAEAWDRERHVGMQVMMEKHLDQMRVYGDAVTAVYNDVQQIKVDVSELRADVSELKHDMIEVKGKLGNLEDDMVEVKDRLGAVEGDVSQIKTYIFENVEPRMMVIESSYA